MKNSEDKEWLERTLFNFREGSCSPEEIGELRARLGNSREAKKTYLRWNLLDCMLEMPRAVPFRKQRIVGYCLAGLAGAGIAALVALMLWPELKEKGEPSRIASLHHPVAELQTTRQTVMEGLGMASSGSIEQGALSIERGIAQLSFRNGAQIVLEGHCGFEIVDEMKVILNHGKMWAYCPPDAHGFKVLTPGGAEIIDLGTEFGVEVAVSGETQVHVFDGLVDVIAPATGERRLEGGEALAWSDQPRSAVKSKANPEAFITMEHLARLRWEDHRKQMMEREDVILFFDGTAGSDGRLENLANHPEKAPDGEIKGASHVAGRIDRKQALEFARPGDGVALDLSGSGDSFTIAMWVKLDRFVSAYAALLNADGWKPGDLHFQITRDGRIRSGYHSGFAFESEQRVVKTGNWHLLAVSWDGPEKTMKMYADGKRLDLRGLNNLTKRDDSIFPRLGFCHLGSWNSENVKNFDVMNRDLRGRIDEVMIFNRMLSDEEMKILYNNSRL